MLQQKISSKSTAIRLLAGEGLLVWGAEAAADDFPTAVGLLRGCPTDRKAIGRKTVGILLLLHTVGRKSVGRKASYS